MHTFTASVWLAWFAHLSLLGLQPATTVIQAASINVYDSRGGAGIPPSLPFGVASVLR